MSQKYSDKIILFDGVCNLCNGFVQFVIKRDQNNSFQFAALQSETAQKLLEDYGFSSDKMDSIILIDVHQKKVWTESSAALRIFKGLKGWSSWLYVFIIFPKIIRDAVYKLIAKNRYRWFGKQNECMVPSPELKQRFLED